MTRDANQHSKYPSGSSVADKVRILQNNKGRDRDDERQEFQGCLNKSEFPAVIDHMADELKIEGIGNHSRFVTVARPFPVYKS